MKDTIIRALRIIIGGGLLLYVIYLFINNNRITQYENFQLFIFLLLFIIALFILILGIYLICIPKPRLNYLFFGLFLILFGNYALVDNPTNYIFIADIIKIIGVLFAIAGPFGLLVPYSCLKKIEESKIEIIEV